MSTGNGNAGSIPAGRVVLFRIAWLVLTFILLALFIAGSRHPGLPLSTRLKPGATATDQVGFPWFRHRGPGDLLLVNRSGDLSLTGRSGAPAF
jgi:hypothetical protein